MPLNRSLAWKIPSSVNRASPHLIIVVAALWLTRTFWLPGRFVVGFDTFAYSGPNAEITARGISQGRLPLLNDFIFGGVTHFGNPQTGVMYLPRLLTAVMDTNRAMGLLVVGHVMLLGLGMYIFLRRSSVSSTSATISAVALMASGAVMIKSIQFEQIIVIAWLPWLLTVILVAFEFNDLSGGDTSKSLNLRPVGYIALVTAAICSAGHPQLTFESAFVAAIFTCGLVLSSGWNRHSLRRMMNHLAKVTAGALLGVVLVLPQMWASLQATRASHLRDGRKIEELGTAELALTGRAAARALLGTWESVNPASFVGSFESVSYIGVAMVLLASLGVISALRLTSRQPWVLALAVTGLAALIFSLGPRTILFRAAFRFLPGFDFARVSARWLVILTIVVCAIAAVGLDRLREGLDRFAVFSLGVITLLGIVVVVGMTTLPEVATSTVWLATAVVVLGLAALTMRKTSPAHIALVVGLLAVTEVLVSSVSSIPQVGRSNTPFTNASSELTNWLSQQDGYTVALTADFGPLPDVVTGLRPNANVLVNVRSIDGYDGGVQITQRWAESLYRFTPTPNAELPLRNNLTPPINPFTASRTGIHHLLIDRTQFDSTAAAGWTGPVRSSGDFDLYQNPQWKGEALAWPVARLMAPAAINEALRTNALSLANVALIDQRVPLLSGSCRSNCNVTELGSTRETPERIRITASLPTASLVTFPIQTGNGWHVTVNGKESPVVPLDGLFLGVVAPAGDHTIIFEYRPGWITPTFALSGMALIGVTWCLLSRGIRRRRRPKEDKIKTVVSVPA